MSGRETSGQRSYIKQLKTAWSRAAAFHKHVGHPWYVVGAKYRSVPEEPFVREMSTAVAMVAVVVASS